MLLRYQKAPVLPVYGEQSAPPCERPNLKSPKWTGGQSQELSQLKVEGTTLDILKDLKDLKDLKLRSFKGLHCNPNGRRDLLRIPSTVGRSVCLCWAPSKPKGPKGSAEINESPSVEIR